jgi:hypothetical protein
VVGVPTSWVLMGVMCDVYNLLATVSYL